MDQQDMDEDNNVELPNHVADARAAVLIHVHEETKHEAESDAEKESSQNDGK